VKEQIRILQPSAELILTVNHNERFVMTDGSSIAWLGLDAHSQNCVLAHLDHDGIQRHWWRFPTSGLQLLRHLSAMAAPDKRLVLEESNLARWISQLLRPQVQQLVVCDARHNRLISSHPNKHDQRDAFNLARLFRLGELKVVWCLPGRGPSQ